MGMRVLVVEDNAVLAEAIQAFLETEGYAVAVATNGSDALRLAQSVCFDLGLSDINLPGRDGFAVCEELRRLYGIPVVLMTAYGLDDLPRRAAKAGAFRVLRKPFSPDALLSTLQQATQSKPS